MSKPGFIWITPVVFVHDLVASLEHYEKILGFDRTWQWSDANAFTERADPTFACITRGEYSLFLSQKAVVGDGRLVCLNVRTAADLENLFQEYKASGAEIVEEPQDRSWGMREMVVRDPDGNTFRMGLAFAEAKNCD